MRHLILLIFSTLSMHFCHAQIHELGVYIGGSNAIADVGATNYISPNKLAFGGIYKWNRSKRHAYRASIIFSDLEGFDTKSDDPRRQQRGYQFNNSILEIAAGMEFTFLDFDLHTGRKLITPYLFTGLSYTKYNDMYFDTTPTSTNLEPIETGQSNWTFGIPITLGVKATFIEGFILAAEVGARYTFTDALDGSFNSQPQRIGNINNKDWYVFSGLTLTYTFGERPCYCYY